MLAASMLAIGALVDWRTLGRAGGRTVIVAVTAAAVLLGGVFGVATVAFG
jgi:hypothetical protein